MLKEAAINKFFSSFGVKAYEQNSVPDGSDRPAYPYITYELRTDAFGEYDTSVLFSIWDSNSSIARVVQIKDAISRALGEAGKMLNCDDGYILIMRDSPFADLRAEEDKKIKRELCSIKMRFYTRY